MKMSKQGVMKVYSHGKLLQNYLAEPAEVDGANKKVYRKSDKVKAQLKIFHDCATQLLPQFKNVLDIEFQNVMFDSGYSPREDDIYHYFVHVMDLIKAENEIESEIEEGNVFLGVQEKLRQAGDSFRNKDAPGLFSSLHTIIEIMIKDKLNIAIDIDGARLGRVLGICMSEGIFPGMNAILKSLDDAVCQIDNKVKHNGYNPSAKEMNDALAVTTQAARLLEKSQPILSNQAAEKIFSLLTKNN